MRITYICDRCGALIGVLSLTEKELQQMGIDLLTVDLHEDIIKSAETGDLFIYSLCDHCAETAPIHEAEWPYRRKPDVH
ncbi:MAG: anti-sigma-F factor Fin family protein [Firmicutes bacterium]|nr:anti-sigma-F factor Fin family protein [Bacillota bacterium]